MQAMPTYRRNLRLDTDRERLVPMVAAVFLLTASLGCGGNSAKGAQAQSPPPVPVKLEVAKNIPVNDTSEYVATLKSRDTAVIMPQVEGYITDISVHSGEHVTSGAALMQIDPSKQQATLRSQEDAHAAQVANVQWAQAQYDRTSKLYQGGVASRQEYDQAETALNAAKAQLRALEAQVHEQRVQLHYYKVVSPRTGIVGDVPVRVGDRVTTSTVLTTVDKPGSLEAYIYVPVEKAPDLRPNTPLQIVDGAGKVLAESRITFISPQVDNTTQTVLAKATITNNQDKLRNSQFIRARVVWATNHKPTVPVISVSRIGGQYFVFVAENQNGKLVAHQKAIEVGEIVGNDYVVQRGIEPGDKVIVSGTQFLTDGAPVAPQQQSTGSGL
jgi:RND family efflux transporter MFP subunit